MRERRVTGAVLLTAVALSLTGCAVPDAFSIFDREAGPRDVLPPSLDEVPTSDLDLTTVRYAATHEGTELYLAKSITGDICLAVGSDVMPVIACGGPTGSFGTSAARAGSYEVRPAPIGEQEGWTVLTENIRVRD